MSDWNPALNKSFEDERTRPERVLLARVPLGRAATVVDPGCGPGFASLAPGGVLAVQMPDNRDEPSHPLMREVAALPAFAGWIDEAASVRTQILPLHGYPDLLAPLAAGLDLWRKACQHPMASPAKIVGCVSSTGLRPFIDPLPAAERTAFLAEYESRIAQADTPRADGRLLLAFPRLFFVATRA